MTRLNWSCRLGHATTGHGFAARVARRAPPTLELMGHPLSIRRAASVCLALGLLGLSVGAHALSCIGVDDRFFARCSGGNCVVEFRARDIPALGACARRTIVESVPSDVAQVVVDRALKAPLAGEYEITLVHRYYSDPPVSAEELTRAFAAHELKVPRTSVRSLTAGTNVQQLRDE